MARRHRRRLYLRKRPHRRARHCALRAEARERSSRRLHRLGHALRLPGIREGRCRGALGGRNPRCALRQDHPHPGALVRRARARRRRRRDDYLEPQPRAVERREVQGQLRRRRQPRHHRSNRKRSAAARTEGRYSGQDRRSRLRAHLHRGARELRRPRGDQALRLPLPHRHDVRRRQGLHRRHLHARWHPVRRVPQRTQSSIPRHQPRAHPAAHRGDAEGGRRKQVRRRTHHRR